VKEIINTFPGSFWWLKLAGLVLNSSTYGAYASSFAAASPLVVKERSKYHGAYIVPGNKTAKQTDLVLSDAKQEELWNFTQQFLKELGID
jgi:hypothetical protein